MWKNELEKFNFNMDKKIQLVSLFSGIGAFEESLDVLGVPTNIKHFAEVDIDAIISYAAIHIPNFINLEFYKYILNKIFLFVVLVNVNF